MKTKLNSRRIEYGKMLAKHILKGIEDYERSPYCQKAAKAVMDEFYSQIAIHNEILK